VPWPWNLAGVVLVVAGFASALAGNLQFRRHQNSVIPFTRSSTVVTDGIFRYTRNPMYLGLVLTLAGAAIGMQALSPWIVVVAFAAFLHFFFIRPEEGWMRMQFGEPYEAYTRQVRRWI
jgi:protein-S-isoprenylcysteine O-methyltransferase Ste14